MTQKYPIFLPLFAFILGILLAEYTQADWILIIVLVPAFGIAALFKPKFRFLILVPIGILFSASPPLPENHVSNFAGKTANIEGVLTESPETRQWGSRVTIDTNRIFIDRREEKTSGKVVLNVREQVRGLTYGDRIKVIKVKLRYPSVCH